MLILNAEMDYLHNLLNHSNQDALIFYKIRTTFTFICYFKEEFNAGAHTLTIVSLRIVRPSLETTGFNSSSKCDRQIYASVSGAKIKNLLWLFSSCSPVNKELYIYNFPNNCDLLQMQSSALLDRLEREQVMGLGGVPEQLLHFTLYQVSAVFRPNALSVPFPIGITYTTVFVLPSRLEKVCI